MNILRILSADDYFVGSNRQHEKSLWRFTCANYLLAVHFILSIFVTVLVAALNGRMVRPETLEEFYISRESLYKEYGITVLLKIGNINSIFTAVLVVVRVVTASWSTTVAWRSVILLMEKGILDLRRLNSTISWKMLWLLGDVQSWFVAVSNWFQNKTSPTNAKRKNNGMHKHFVAIILLLMWPATFSAPILTGALEWLPRNMYAEGELLWDSQGSGSMISLTMWKDFLANNYSIRRDYVDIIVEYVTRAMLEPNQPPLDRCQHIVFNQSVQTEYYRLIRDKSHLINRKFPCIEVRDIQWRTAKDVYEDGSGVSPGYLIFLVII